VDAGGGGRAGAFRASAAGGDRTWRRALAAALRAQATALVDAPAGAWDAEERRRRGARDRGAEYDVFLFLLSVWAVLA